jgi:transposase
MLQIDRINDVDQLKQVTRLALKENEKLHKRIVELTQEIARLKGESSQGKLELELERLQRQLDRFQRRLFAESSEKRGSSGKDASTSETPRRGHGPRVQKKLPIEEVVHELAEDERRCPACSGALSEMQGQYEESDEITVVRRQFILLRHRRQKYRCRCNGAVVTAPGPVKLIPGGRYAVEFAVEVATSKYLDHLPLDRQRRIMAREGLEIDTQTLWDQLHALYRHLKPTYEALGRRVLDSPQIGADETWWRVMGKGVSKRWWDWCLSTPDAVFHTIHRSRSAEAVRELLAGYEGTAITDGYKAYETLARAESGVKLAHCWSHVRRKYIEIESFYPEPCREILDLIQELYALEKTVPAGDDALAQRARVRQEQSASVVKRIRDWALAQKSSPRSGLREAIEYMLSLWTGLTRFLEDPSLPLDNNATERALRGVVLGRKNHLGSRSERGTRVAALFYSLLETAKLCDLEPRDYLAQAARRAIADPGSVLLPHDLLKSPQQESAA